MKLLKQVLTVLLKSLIKKMYNFNSHGYLNPQCRLRLYESNTHAGMVFVVYNKQVVLKGMVSYGRFKSKSDLIRYVFRIAEEKGISIIEIDKD